MTSPPSTTSLPASTAALPTTPATSTGSAGSAEAAGAVGAAARTEWAAVCPDTSLESERGVAALVAGHQVAVFRLHDGTVHALDHHDPGCGANVLARGLVGTRGGRAVVISPMYKQAYDLTTGECLDDPALRVGVHRARLRSGIVEVAFAEGARVEEAR